MRQRMLTTLVALVLVQPVGVRGADGTIPQDPKRQEERFRDKLAWNQRTLIGAYEKVGKKDSRWDELARETLQAAARCFSQVIDPYTSVAEVFAQAKRAVDAGCDDPLILFIYAWSSYNANYPGEEELGRRYLAAAAAMEHSAYPPFRRAIALCMGGRAKAFQKDRPVAVREEATRLLDAAIALLPKSLEEDGRSPDLQSFWVELSQLAIGGHRQLSGNGQAALDRVDAGLAQVPALRTVRLRVKGRFFIEFAWEARGSGFANTVTQEGWKNFRERLTAARAALDEAWKIEPNDGHAAALMLIVEKGLGGSRDDVEKWFERAMKADGNNKQACVAKMDWLDPKWHGTREELLAFGRACRDTKNWRTGITLLLAECHRRAATSLPAGDQEEYLRSEEVWNDIRAVFEEYLSHIPEAATERSCYAGYCYMCGRHAESDKQFRVLGENLVPTADFPEAWLKEVKACVAAKAAPPAEASPMPAVAETMDEIGGWPLFPLLGATLGCVVFAGMGICYVRLRRHSNR
jgi:hypothetical protein